MDLSDSPAEAAFRSEVRAFLEESGHFYPREQTPWGDMGDDPETMERFEQWRAAIVERGWIAPHWPKEYGGAGLSPREQFVLNEEFARHGVTNAGGSGVSMIGPTLIIHGTEEQKAEHLTKILSGERRWAQGWSEPGAGSDLASLQTRAVRDGDEYVVNGQKIWTSGAHRADWIFMLARTDPDAPKHRGISLLLFDIRSPGVSIRPLINMAFGHHFNEVFFEDVRVPVRNRLGEENRGWYVGMTLTDFERSGIGNATGVARKLENLLDTAKAGPASEVRNARRPDGAWRLELADRWVEVNVARLFSYRIMTLQTRGLVPNHEASVSKLFTTELNQRIARTTHRMYGLYGQMWDYSRPEAMGGQASYGYLRTISASISGGSSEIQRNVIATRGLGLPRG
ncbi:MAG: acyl-CoA dehydrogenase family protein [Dehalococcoidia bacterium]|nr:acyl-CoA dehydrogenase family protein [Dehalococcoidia bacterium]